MQQSLFVLALLAIPTGACVAQITFDHAAGEDSASEINIGAGETLNVTIVNTCPGLFDYQAFGLVGKRPAETSASPGAAVAIALAPPAAGQSCSSVLTPGDIEKHWEEALKTSGVCALTEKQLSITTESKFSRYLIEVDKRSGAPEVIKGIRANEAKAEYDKQVATEAAKATSNCQQVLAAASDSALKGAQSLKNQRFIVETERSAWAIALSGGITVSDLTDPKFAVINDAASTATPPGTIVVRDKSAEDANAIGLAGFIHVLNNKVSPWIPMPTLGFGISSENDINAFAGLSWHASDLAYLTFGWNWGQVDRLPSGQQLGQPPISSNVLNELPTRTDSGFFLGLSAQFMSPGKEFFSSKTATKKDSSPAK